MPENMSDLKKELGTTFEEFKKANDQKIAEAEKRNGEATAETNSKVDALNARIAELTESIRAIETRNGRPAAGSIVQPNGSSPDLELRKRAYEKYIRYGTGETGLARMSPEEQRALAGTSDEDGQYLVPEDFETTLIMKAFDLAEIRPYCQVGTTSRDAVKMGALSKPLVAWGTKGLAVSEQTLNAGGIIIPVKNVRALALISNDTLDDSAANVMGELEMAFEKAVAEAEDDAFAVGAEPESPKGIMVNATVLSNATASGVAAAISDATHNGLDALKSMMFALKKVYRRNARWAMNSTTEGLYRQLKDGNGQYLWDPMVDKDGAPTLLGRPVINPEGMPDVAANAYPVLFGDFFSGYKIRDRSGITIKRLVERYAEYDQTAFILKKRVGGGVALAEAFRVLKIAASV